VKRRLSSIGNSQGIIIAKPILELLKIDEDTDLDITTDGEALIIRPIRTSHAERVKDAAEQIAARHRDAFEKLAK